MRFVVQVCEKCSWVGTHKDCVHKKDPNTDSTWFCPRCGGEVVCVSLKLTIKDLWKAWIGNVNVYSSLE